MRNFLCTITSLRSILSCLLPSPVSERSICTNHVLTVESCAFPPPVPRAWFSKIHGQKLQTWTPRLNAPSQGPSPNLGQTCCRVQMFLFKLSFDSNPKHQPWVGQDTWTKSDCREFPSQVYHANFACLAEQSQQHLFWYSFHVKKILSQKSLNRKVRVKNTKFQVQVQKGFLKTYWRSWW